MNTINLVLPGGYQSHVTQFPCPSSRAVHNPVNYIFVFDKQLTANKPNVPADDMSLILSQYSNKLLGVVDAILLLH